MKDGENDFNELEAKYGLPKEVKFCKKCVISNQRPNSCVEFKYGKHTKKETINFDKDGICDACKYAEKKEKEVDWKKREQELRELCDKYRRNDGRFDCVVPGSGGKDSVMTAWLLKHKYGMHPLTVTWTPHIHTDVGWKNFQKWIHSGFDNVLYSPNGKVHRLLTKLAFKNLLHPFQPFILGQKNIGPKYAALYDIPLVFYGENEAEYGNPIKDNENAIRDAKYHIDTEFKNFYISGLPISELIEKYELTKNDLEPYLPLSPEIFKEKKIQVHYMGYYEKWDPQEAYYFAVERSGFEANSERTEGTYSKYNSIDDRTDPFHYFTILIKFGIGRASYDASQEIRNKKITREEGVALVKKFDQEFPKKYFKEFLEYMGITEEEFWETIDSFRSPHLWKKEDGVWKLRHQVS